MVNCRPGLALLRWRMGLTGSGDTFGAASSSRDVRGVRNSRQPRATIAFFRFRRSLLYATLSLTSVWSTVFQHAYRGRATLGKAIPLVKRSAVSETEIPVPALFSRTPFAVRGGESARWSLVATYERTHPPHRESQSILHLVVLAKDGLYAQFGTQAGYQSTSTRFASPDCRIRSSALRPGASSVAPNTIRRAAR